jgi:WS/DGAT/MGAT family acyltransferase
VAAVDRLSALDAVFLAIENDRDLMHVGLTAIFEKGPLRTPDGGLDRSRIRRYARAVLASLPKFRRRIARVPVVRRPVLVDDDRFDLGDHVHFESLAGSGDAELEQLVGRIYSRRIDRAHALWEVWIIDGLSGDRFAVVSKAHHCLVDGVSGIAAFTAMLRPSPETTFDENAEWRLERPPSPRALVEEELRRWVGTLRDAASARPDHLVEGARTFVTGLSRALAAALPPASKTSLNPPRIGPRRRVAFCEIDLRVVKAVKTAASVKVNDVVLATIAGALRRYLARRGERLEDIVFRALVPVSTHPTGEVPVSDNEVSALVIPLPLAEPDAKRRLDAVARSMKLAKSSGAVRAVELTERLADMLSFGLATLVVRVGIRVRPYNVIVTNIPGPGIPLYLLGARLLSVFPMVPLYENNALGVAILSYDNKLFWGLSVDADRVSDLHRLREDLREAFGEMEDCFLR